MSYKENAHANKLFHHGYSQKKMKISIRMVLVLQWVLAICALSSRDWLPPGYQWCQVRLTSYKLGILGRTPRTDKLSNGRQNGPMIPGQNCSLSFF